MLKSTARALASEAPENINAQAELANIHIARGEVFWKEGNISEQERLLLKHSRFCMPHTFPKIIQTSLSCDAARRLRWTTLNARQILRIFRRNSFDIHGDLLDSCQRVSFCCPRRRLVRASQMHASNRKTKRDGLDRSKKPVVLLDEYQTAASRTDQNRAKGLRD